VRVGLERAGRRSSSAPRAFGAYLEQSTRYIAYDAPDGPRRRAGGAGPDSYRYLPRDPRARPSLHGGDGRAVLDLLRRACRGGRVPGPRGEFPRGPDEPPAAHGPGAIKAKALDLLRGAPCPPARLSHMGIFATGQTYEQLILHLLAHPLPEAPLVRRDDPRRDQVP